MEKSVLEVGLAYIYILFISKMLTTAFILFFILSLLIMKNSKKLFDKKLSSLQILEMSNKYFGDVE